MPQVEYYSTHLKFHPMLMVRTVLVIGNNDQDDIRAAACKQHQGRLRISNLKELLSCALKIFTVLCVYFTQKLV